MTDTTLDPGTFDLLAVAEGRSYPEDDITIYLDHNAAYRLARLETRIAEEKDPGVVGSLDETRQELIKRVKDSALVFHLRGLSQRVIRAVENTVDAKFGAGDDSPERVAWSNNAFMAAHIVRVTNAAGEQDKTVWDAEKITQLQDVIPAESYDSLYQAMTLLTFIKVPYFEQVETSPDFS